MIDEAIIHVKSGDGGNGIVHFHTEKFITRGGPDGGDGGRGGNVVLVAKRSINTLLDFSRKRKFAADNGKTGGTKNQTGKSADDIRIHVPCGTMVYDVKTGDLLADLTDHEQEFIAAKGGRGGRGNPHWKGPSNQAPRIAEKGVPGEEREIRLELRLIADVGIVGVPNAGKSTLLSVISNAKPKIADYPFTTLEPNLGLVVVGSTDFVVADIPGLVEGAHMGVGLGHAFLRHVQRTRVLIHLLDGSAENPLADFNQINAELALFDEQLAKKPQIVVLNKLDLPEAEAKWKKVEKELLKRGYDCFQISAATHMNTQVMMNRVAAVLADLPVEAASAVPVRALHKLDEAQFIFTVSRRDDGSYQVNGDRIERAAKMTYWELDESVNRFQKILAVTGITKALEEAGVQVGDTVHIGSFELEWSD